MVEGLAACGSPICRRGPWETGIFGGRPRFRNRVGVMTTAMPQADPEGRGRIVTNFTRLPFGRALI